MSESSAKQAAQHPEPELLDDTMRLPALEQLLADSEETSGARRQSPADTDQILLTAQLRRLVELSESIDGRLGQIAELLAAQRPRSRRVSARKKTSRKAVKSSGAAPGTSAAR